MKKLLSFIISPLVVFMLISCSSDNDELYYYTVKLSVRDNTGGSAYINSPGNTLIQVSEKGEIELYATPYEGYDFDYWEYTINGETRHIKENPYKMTDIDSHLVIYALFKEASDYEDDDHIIIFEDDFEGESGIPDPEKWELCPKATSNWNRYNSESYDQAYIKDGKLVLTGEKTEEGYKTGAIRMLGSLAVEYCTVEVRARFTKMGQGTWPAIWMMPANPIYSGWPSCGEIDIMEHLNKDANYYCAVHSYYIDTLGKNYPVSSKKIDVDQNDFNIYSMKWNKDEIICYLNRKQVFRYQNLQLENEDELKQWPFDTTFYLILNQALGGEGTWPGVIDNESLPAIFEIDWVKIFK